ncbi:hypothetical protein L9F63_007514, partial [Diploptera punctata]
DNTGGGDHLITPDGDTISVMAIDNYDKGENGTDGMKYTIIGDETATEFLELSNAFYPPHPTIELKKGFKNETKKIFLLEIEACDAKCTGNTIPLKTVWNTTIVIQGGLFPPFFNGETFTTDFTENETGLVEFREITINATDNRKDGSWRWHEQCEDAHYRFFFMLGGEDKAEDYFELDKYNKTLKLKKELDREKKALYTFQVRASNNEIIRDNDDLPPDSELLRVYVMVNDVIDTAPKFTESIFTGGIVFGDKRSEIAILTLNATDEDLNDTLKYSINNIIPDSSMKNIKDPFELREDSGNLLQTFDAEDSSYKGQFDIEVMVRDTCGYNDTATARVYMISEDNILVFTFSDSRDFVDSRRSIIEEVFREVLSLIARIRQVVRSTQSGTTPDENNGSGFIAENSGSLVIGSNLSRDLINAHATYTSLINMLSDNRLHLVDIESPADKSTSNMEGILQTVLIAVTVVLGTLVIILFAAFFIKTRSLNRRLEALSTTKFGSQDSGLNRIGIAVPNTNRHAVEGSNPVWGNEEVNQGFDTRSISSGDSDLIGVEENPEFRSGNTTPDVDAPRRPTGHPILDANPEFGMKFNPFSYTGGEMEAEAGGQKQSVNPLAGSNLNYMKDESDEESEVPEDHNSNFSFTKRTDPSTEL